MFSENENIFPVTTKYLYCVVTKSITTTTQQAVHLRSMSSKIVEFSLKCMYLAIVKLLFTISVVKDHLIFMTKIPCTDDLYRNVFVESNYLPNVTSDCHILHPHSHSPGVWDHSRVHIYLFWACVSL